MKRCWTKRCIKKVKNIKIGAEKVANLSSSQYLPWSVRRKECKYNTQSYDDIC